jgi:hypothetical protein
MVGVGFVASMGEMGIVHTNAKYFKKTRMERDPDAE